ncbi:dTDP-glucose 4,6-dehydratase [Methanoculleus sp.]|uniref:dTDP-glucose 4,6-dehydratase n=1 Tax=Methanoculleus sp. TaxID=90427 RepID=UPI002637E6EC|nr:dTDP-glucose 4,6-dehydratase [Methanoculleus sp.]MDD2788970.1 dTDP-glucose 4,6-dehydratase [Methanoculleus sp.]
MKTYLVTGGCGFIGSNFILYLFKKYGEENTIINLDKLTYAGNPENLRSIEKLPNYIFVQGDICDEKCIREIFNSYEIDYVVHFAAESHVDRSILSSKEFVVSNVLGTTVLLDAARKAWLCGDDTYLTGKRYLQVSTDEVYGALGATGYFSERTPLDPHSPYSASKAAADLLVKSYYDTHKMPINITRCSNNYGPYQYPEKLIPLIITNCLIKKPLPVYGDGMNVRDWLYVEDHCRAIDLVLEKGIIGEIYNIGGHNEWTNIEIIKIIISYLHNYYDTSIDESLITFVTDRKGHDRRYAIDATKIEEELGWVPIVSFQEGIIKTIEWYIANLDLIPV